MIRLKAKKVICCSARSSDILRSDIDNRTSASKQELAARIHQHYSGTLGCEFRTTERVRSIAFARGIVVKLSDGWSGLERPQLIRSLRDSDAAVGPFKLLELPPELRTEIFSYVILPEDEDALLQSPVLPKFPPLLFVNMQLKMEVGEIFMKKCRIALPCVWDEVLRRTNDNKTNEIEISAPEETLEWMRTAGIDLLSVIRSCLMIRRVSSSSRYSYVFDIKPAARAGRYNIRMVGEIKDYPSCEAGDFDLIGMRVPIQSQLELSLEQASEVKLSRTNACRMAQSFGLLEGRVAHITRQRWDLDRALLLLNWV